MSERDVQIENRRRKRQLLEAAGIPAYPHRARCDLEPSEVHARYGALDGAGLEEVTALAVPGRLRAQRTHGKATFLDLHDGVAKLQVLVRSEGLTEAGRVVLENLDLGDYLGASGRLIRTRTGELTLEAGELVLLAKALRPLPEKWHGLTDVEARYRQRYLDLVANPDSRRVFEIRAAIVRTLRELLDERGFLEVETPMMQPVPGGAAARPFITHHNALDLDLYLRVAPELYLKRLLVGGLHRVYEINRNFRNEGISTQHNPEFTMLEFYWAYSDYLRLMEFTEELFGELARRVLGTEKLVFQGRTLDLGAGWRRVTVREAISVHGGIPPERLEHVADLAAEFELRDLPWPAAVDDTAHPVLHAGERELYVAGYPDVLVPAGWYGHLLMGLFEATAEEHLQQPTFVHDFPADVSPLAKETPRDPRFVERFEVYAGGMELVNAFTELNDPDVQAERFRQQLAARARGDQEAHRFDHDYVEALAHGMPPAGGEGVGIDRLTMLFSDRSSIRDVILFPLLRPQGQPGEE